MKKTCKMGKILGLRRDNVDSPKPHQNLLKPRKSAGIFISNALCNIVLFYLTCKNPLEKRLQDQTFFFGPLYFFPLFSKNHEFWPFLMQSFSLSFEKIIIRGSYVVFRQLCIWIFHLSKESGP